MENKVMTQEEKELLLKDICARLLYGVKVTWDGKHSLIVTPHIYCAIISEDNINNLPKLLLRPMSSMTEEEKDEYYDSIFNSHLDLELDWLLERHFDYRGLIDKGLAIEVTKENNPYKE